MKKMEIHKKFIDKLSLMKLSTVGGVIEKIGLVERDSRGNIIGVLNNIEDVIQIFYTVDYLIENNFVSLIGVKNNDNPDFIQDLVMNTFEKNNNDLESSLERKQYSYALAMPRYIKKYWGMELLIEPGYFKMIRNGYKTDLEKKEIVNRRISLWVPILVAILVSFLTALFSYFLRS